MESDHTRINELLVGLGADVEVVAVGDEPVGAPNCVVAGQAALRYSLMSSPQRAVFTTWRFPSGWSAASVATGGSWFSERWGRWVL